MKKCIKISFLCINMNKVAIIMNKSRINTALYVYILVRSPGLEPGWLPIRPSNVRVCRFRHDRKIYC